jgi:hypothetical protein
MPTYLGTKKMDRKPPENTYLQQVLQEQEEINLKLQKRRSPAAPEMALQSNIFTNNNIISPPHIGKSIEYRITGFWLWKSVVVPPNVYVVHTRKGHQKPVNIGMGISFAFNPLTDAFLIIPSAVQTILINANCICSERQGILVQAYVQWIIDDINTAYWKLDFSDGEDPMGIVNIQLREQAEAAIKDKVATMSIEEVLSDKQPIIEELTNRLQTVAEGSRDEQQNSEGLGLKIVTVQIKEAVVSSAQLWQNLQIPFRAQREKIARLAELENSEEIKKRELENRVIQERDELNAQSELDSLKASQQRNNYDREHNEMLRRHTLEAEGRRQTLREENVTLKAQNDAKLELVLQEVELEKRRITAEKERLTEQMLLDAIEREKLQDQITGELKIKELENIAHIEQKQRELNIETQRKDIENNISQSNLEAQLIAQLPQIAQNLPTPDTQNTTIITTDNQDGGMNNVLSFISSILSLIKSETNKTKTIENDQ